MLNLREYSKHTKRGNRLSPVVGEVVLLEESLPRSKWKLCRIENLIPGADKKIRAAEIRCENGSILRRLIQQLYPLEVGNDGDKDKKVEKVQTTSRVTKKRRNAAVEAESKMAKFYS